MNEGEGYSSEQWGVIKAMIARVIAAYPPHPGSTTWYVDSVAGSDTTGDGSQQNPWQTITYAITQASDRDTIIAWGTFTEDSLSLLTGMRLYGLGNGLSILNKTTNTNPGIIIDNDGCEFALFVIDGGTTTGHGIRIIDGNYAHIHHNIIRNITGAYDGIDKSSGGVIVGVNIHDNEIIDGALGSGIGLVNVTESRFEDNIILRNASQGIILNANCDDNVLQENICNENDVGIQLQGDNNEVVNNTMQNNTVLDYIDTGTNNTRTDLQKKPQWGTASTGNGTPAGLGVPLTLISLTPIVSGDIVLSLGISRYVAGDNSIITIQIQVDGANWQTVGYVSVNNGNIIAVVGTPYFTDPAVPIAAATIGALQWRLHTDTHLLLQVIVNQAAGNLRQVDYHYNILDEI